MLFTCHKIPSSGFMTDMSFDKLLDLKYIHTRHAGDMNIILTVVGIISQNNFCTDYTVYSYRFKYQFFSASNNLFNIFNKVIK